MFRIKLFLFCALGLLTLGLEAASLRSDIVPLSLPKAALPTLSCSEYFHLAMDYIKSEDYSKALKNLKMVLTFFPGTPEYDEALFYSGVCHYQLYQFQQANQQFVRYLALPDSSAHFHEIFSYKYSMAESFRKKESRSSLVKLQRRVKWGSGTQVAHQLYREVEVSLPNDPLCDRSLYNRAKMFSKTREFKEAIPLFQTLCRRSPRDPLAVKSYLKIAQAYLLQAQRDAQNPDFIDLARVNLNKLSASFPSDEESIAKAKDYISEMEEIHAQSLCKVAAFYEKKKKRGAAALYYREALTKFPQTKAAQHSQQRLNVLGV